jgi:homoserine O-acetyltransferase/O-succinyltransferase
MLALFFAAALTVTPVDHDYVVKDFHFASGETMPEVRMHYITYGTHRGNNVVLILHGTSGSSKQFIGDNFAGELFAAGGLLDANRFFIVIPDNVGHGKSSKPSDGLGAKFPHYTYTDMIELQHRVLAEDLGVTHLYLILGTSMGAMHSWMWGERWPDAMDALVPLASAPTQIAGRNRIWRRMIIDDLHRGDLEGAVQILMIATSAPLVWQKNGPTRDGADHWYEEQMKTRLASNNVDDLLYAVEASRDYDPSPQLERITAPLLAINSADDFVNPPELGIVETLIKRVKHGRFVLLPITSETRGHGTHTVASVWKSELARFLAAIPPSP